MASQGNVGAGFKYAPPILPVISKALMGGDPAHGWPHVVRVHRYAVAIAIRLKRSVDWLTLETAVLLHDVGRFLPGEGRHAEKSAAFAATLLPGIGFTGDVNAVIHAILAHSHTMGVKAETLEAMILSDADKLDALGAIGIARVFHTGCQLGRSFEESLSHFEEKILGLRDEMYLEESKRLAEGLLGLVKEYVEAMRRELSEPP